MLRSLVKVEVPSGVIWESCAQRYIRPGLTRWVGWVEEA